VPARPAPRRAEVKMVSTERESERVQGLGTAVGAARSAAYRSDCHSAPGFSTKRCSDLDCFPTLLTR
jgi:hypothetical protein